MRFVLLLITILLLIGCVAMSPTIPLELQYKSPTGHENSLVSLVGSQEKRTLFGNFTVYTLAVDGKRVMTGPENWNKTLTIEPGTRNLTVAFLSATLNTQVDLQLHAVAGSNYQIQFSTDARFFGTSTYCDFWIIDLATQKPVTGVKRGNLIFSIQYSPSID